MELDNTMSADGYVVFKNKEDFFNDCFELINVNGSKLKVEKNRIKDFDSIKKGDKIFSLYFGGEVAEMVVEDVKANDKTATAKVDQYLYAKLAFGEDFRNCWTCKGYALINPEGIIQSNYVIV